MHVILFFIPRGILEMKLQSIMFDRKHLYESQSELLREKNRYIIMSNWAPSHMQISPHISIHNLYNSKYVFIRDIPFHLFAVLKIHLAKQIKKALINAQCQVWLWVSSFAVGVLHNLMTMINILKRTWCFSSGRRRPSRGWSMPWPQPLSSYNIHSLSTMSYKHRWQIL